MNKNLKRGIGANGRYRPPKRWRDDDPILRGGIYAIHNTVTDERYIGRTWHFWPRFTRHIQYLRRGDHPCAKLQASFSHYGVAAFELEILEIIGDDRDDKLLEAIHASRYFGSLLNSEWEIDVYRRKVGERPTWRMAAADL